MKDRGKKYLRYQATHEVPHVGALLQSHMKQKKVSHAALSRAINRGLVTLMRYYKKQSIQTSILWELSIALKTNFFHDLPQQLPEICVIKPTQQLLDKDAEITRLKAENERLQIERDLLLKIAGK